MKNLRKDVKRHAMGIELYDFNVFNALINYTVNSNIINNSLIIFTI